MKCRCVPVQGAENGLFGECVSPADLSFVTVDGGDTFTVGIMAGGEAVAWGRGFYGEVPAEDGTESAVKNAQAPVQLKLPEPCQAVACGSNHGLALTDSGRVAAWGWNRSGQVAATAEEEVVRIPTIVAFSMPVQIIKVAAGGRHSMAVDSSGRVWAWGSNEYGQLGVGSDVMQLHTPVPVALPTDVRIEHSAAGWAHSALISSGGEVLTFGWGLYNQLGHGATQNEHQPVVVDALRGLDSKVVQVACGNWHSAALTASGDLYTWGWGKDGQLGHGASTATQVLPRVVSISASSAVSDEDQDVLSVACGARFTLALCRDGCVQWWGPKPAADALQGWLPRRLAAGSAHAILLLEHRELEDTAGQCATTAC